LVIYSISVNKDFCLVSNFSTIHRENPEVFCRAALSGTLGGEGQTANKSFSRLEESEGCDRVSILLYCLQAHP